MPRQDAYIFLRDGEEADERLSFGELDHRARVIASYLSQIASPGERALLLYPAGVELIAAFFGCLYAGVIAVPSYPPSRSRRGQPRLRSIAADARPCAVLGDGVLVGRAAELVEQVPELGSATWVATPELAVDLAESWREPEIDAESLAFLQYTSGSTAAPKGVMVRHGNLLHNEEMIQLAFGQSESSVIVGWLPLYHDMGLIGNVLQPLYLGARCLLMSPAAFLQKPLRWLSAISRYRATTSGGPDFAYDLCVRRIGDAERRELDLSSWTVAFNGAEPVRSRTLDRFAEAFAPCGFRREAFFPCYGLAEATLFATGCEVETAPRIARLNAAALERHRAEDLRAEDHRAAPREASATYAGIDLAADSGTGVRELVSCGRPRLEQEIVVADPESCHRLEDGQIGEIWIAGRSIAGGYWQRPELSAEVFAARLTDDAEHGPFLRTGDLGFLDGQELFVTGRLKELIILRGRNVYPQDVEIALEGAHPALRAGHTAAFALGGDGEERLAVVCELDRHGLRADLDEVVAAVRRVAAEELELAIHEVVLIRPGRLPKTSSGKIQRLYCRELLREGGLDELARDVADGMVADGTVGQVASEGSEPGIEIDRERILAARGEERHGLVQQALRIAAARALGRPSEALDPNLPLAAHGLDSLAALELQHVLEQELGVAAAWTDLMAGASLAELATEVEARMAAEEPAVPPSVEASAAGAASDGVGFEAGVGAGEEDQPLTAGQQALGFLHRLTPESSAYHLVHAVRVHGDLDPEALRQAFSDLAVRHPGLRTTFPDVDGRAVSRVTEDPSFDFLNEDAVAWSEAELESRIEAEAQRPFDLENGPLVRLAVWRRGPDEHALLLGLHHIVADFWSLEVMIAELEAFYSAAFARQVAPAASTPTWTLADVARHEHRQLEGARGETLRRFWGEYLAGAPQSLELPTDRPYPPVRSDRGGAVTFRLEDGLGGALEELARQAGTTLFVVLLGAWQVLLGRLSGQREVVVGTPTAGRDRADWARMVGYFVNPVALRGDLRGGLESEGVAEAEGTLGESSFVDFLGRLRGSVLGALAHADMPFNILVDELHAERDPSRSPVFQAMLTLQRESFGRRGLLPFAVGKAGARFDWAGLHLESMAITSRAVQFDLALTLGEVGGALEGSLEHSADLFDATTARRHAAHLRALLVAAVESPTVLLSELPILTAAERHQALREWNATPAVPMIARRVEELVAAHVQARPDAIAVVAPDGHLSYGELGRRAAWVASVIRQRGLGREARVGICLERSTGMIVSLLAVLEAGGAYVPFDPEEPQARLSSCLEDAGAQLALIRRDLAPFLPEALGFLCPEDFPSPDPGPWPMEPSSRLSGAVLQEEAPKEGDAELACVVYTSGSSGRPKGVGIEHRGLINLVTSFHASYGATPADRVLPLTSIASASFVGEILPALAAGGTLVLPGREETLALADLPRRLAEHRVSILSTVPALASRLDTSAAQLPTLRLLLVGGEALMPNDFAHLDGVQVVNGYGLSEATVCSCYHVLAGDHGLEQRSDSNTAQGSGTAVHSITPPTAPPVGRPLVNNSLFVLDARLELVPMGCPGELCIAGMGLARGYLGRAGLSAARWVPHPFRAGERLLRTGDLARWRTDGNLDFLGRIDQQVKIRGHRVEVGEIEAVLGGYPAVAEATVMVRDGRRGKQLVAYWAAVATKASTENGIGSATEDGKNKATSPAELHRFVAERLPSYMVPSAFVELASLPLSANGKVDRGALPPPPEPVRGSSAPTSGLERRLAAVWSAVLKTTEVGTQDNFFEIGGNSLLMSEVHVRLRGEVAEDLSLVDLFRYPTISSLAGFLRSRGDGQQFDTEIRQRADLRRAGLAQRRKLLANRRRTVAPLAGAKP